MPGPLDERGLASYVARQLEIFHPDRDVSPDELIESVRTARDRFLRCQERVKGKYSTLGLNHLHTDHYATFLYFLSNTLGRAHLHELASKTYALNKALHAVDMFYEVELPGVFALQHPVGSVIGRGIFEDFLFVYQRCSIGSSLAGKYPRLHRGVVMFGGSAIIGDCEIGPNTWLSVGTTIMDQNVPGDCVVFGRSPNLVIKRTERNVVRDMFGAGEG